jgi:hypothetical protein
MRRPSLFYLGTSFLRDQYQLSSYIVIEDLSEMLVHEQHKAYRLDAIRTLEKRRATLAYDASLLPSTKSSSGRSAG